MSDINENVEAIQSDDEEPVKTDSEEEGEVEQPKEDSEDEGPPRKRAMFSLPEIKSNRNEWKLPTELREFFVERCQNHLSERELEEFKEINTPKNVPVPTKLDPFMKALLEKRGHHKVVSADEEWQRVHSRLYEITGPLGKVWSQVQTYLHTEEENLDPEEVLGQLNASIVLLGQAINKVAYERRLSVLAALTDAKTAKKDLKDNLEDINKENKLLFGEQFQKQIKTVTKAQESAEKVFSKTKKKTFRPFSSASTGYHNGTQRHNSANNNGGGFSSSTWQTSSRKGMFTNRRGKKLSICSEGKLHGSSRGKIYTPRIKKLISFYPKKHSKERREDKVLLSELEGPDKRSHNFEYGHRLEIANKGHTSTEKGTKRDSYVKNGGTGSRQRNFVNVRERSHKGNSRGTRTIPVQRFCETKEGKGEISTHNKLETSKSTNALHTLQDGGHEEHTRHVKSG